MKRHCELVELGDPKQDLRQPALWKNDWDAMDVDRLTLFPLSPLIVSSVKGVGEKRRTRLWYKRPRASVWTAASFSDAEFSARDVKRGRRSGRCA